MSMPPPTPPTRSGRPVAGPEASSADPHPLFFALPRADTMPHVHTQLIDAMKELLLAIELNGTGHIDADTMTVWRDALDFLLNRVCDAQPDVQTLASGLLCDEVLPPVDA